jgi:hypothetical protein
LAEQDNKPVVRVSSDSVTPPASSEPVHHQQNKGLAVGVWITSQNTNVSVDHVTPEAAAVRVAEAKARVEVAHATFVVPAEERTRQSREETKRSLADFGRLALVAACVLAAIYVIDRNDKAAWALATLISVFTGIAYAPGIIERVKKMPKPSTPPTPQLPPPPPPQG